MSGAMRADEVQRLGSARLISKQIEKMSDEQLNRFEFFMRSHFSRNHIKEMLFSKLGAETAKDIPDDIAIVVGSLSKLFVGEVVETALEVSNELIAADLDDDILDGTVGALKPAHIREAIRRMQCEGKITSVAKEACGGFLFDNRDIDSLSCMDNIAGGELKIE